MIHASRGAQARCAMRSSYFISGQSVICEVQPSMMHVIHDLDKRVCLRHLATPLMISGWMKHVRRADASTLRVAALHIMMSLILFLPISLLQ